VRSSDTLARRINCRHVSCKHRTGATGLEPATFGFGDWRRSFYTKGLRVRRAPLPAPDLSRARRRAAGNDLGARGGPQPVELGAHRSTRPLGGRVGHDLGHACRHGAAVLTTPRPAGIRHMPSATAGAAVGLSDLPAGGAVRGRSRSAAVIGASSRASQRPPSRETQFGCVAVGTALASTLPFRLRRVFGQERPWTTPERSFQRSPPCRSLLPAVDGQRVG
jgi:hypothetical protein